MTNRLPSPAPVSHIGASPVEEITGIWLFQNPPRRHCRCRSLPGHLLHLVLEGTYRLRVNERDYPIQPGDIIYYYESEEVETIGGAEPVSFYSVGFLAATLEPLSADSRVFPASPETRALFQQLYEGSLHLSRIDRQLRCHSALLGVLASIGAFAAATRPVSAKATTWWDVESHLRRTHQFRPSVDDLANLTKSSRATVVRLCRAATGMSPVQRLRELRMDEARGLLLYSQRSVTQVARYLGFPEIHGFSREFSRHFGFPPSALHHAQGG